MQLITVSLRDNLENNMPHDDKDGGGTKLIYLYNVVTMVVNMR